MTKTERIEALESQEKYQNREIVGLRMEFNAYKKHIEALEKEVKALKQTKADKETVWKKIDMGDGNFWYKCVLKEEAEKSEVKSDLDKKKIELMDLILKNYSSDCYIHTGTPLYSFYTCEIRFLLESEEFKRYLELFRPLQQAAK